VQENIEDTYQIHISNFHATVWYSNKYDKLMVLDFCNHNAVMRIEGFFDFLPGHPCIVEIEGLDFNTHIKTFERSLDLEFQSQL